jgi:hypothetical protein
MSTDELIALLARGGGMPQEAPVRRHGLAVASAAVASALLMASMLGVRADLATAAELPMFWLKLAFPGALAGVALVAMIRLSRPGARLAGLPGLLALPLLAVWLIAGAALVHAEPASRTALLFGQSWQSCPFIIAALSAPGLFAALWALKGLAPTRLALAGAAAGVLSGALGALAYALHCPEMAAPFLALWYSLGMLIPAAAGALLGRVLLRW